MTYGCQIWGQSRSTYVNKIMKLQNRALRIINFTAFHADSNPLYRRNKILKLEDIIKLQNCLLVHMNNTLPACFQNYYFRQNHITIIYKQETRLYAVSLYQANGQQIMG